MPKKNKNQKYGRGVDDKRVEVTGGQLHTMFTSSMEVLSWTDFSELGKDGEFTWHQFHVKEWGVRDFEGHTPVAMQNATGQPVTLKWLLLDSQSTVDLIA